MLRDMSPLVPTDLHTFTVKVLRHSRPMDLEADRQLVHRGPGFIAADQCVYLVRPEPADDSVELWPGPPLGHPR